MKNLFLYVFCFRLVQSAFKYPLELENRFRIKNCRYNAARTFFENFDDVMDDCYDKPVRSLRLEGCDTRLTRLEKLPNMPLEKLFITHCRIEEVAEDAFENIGDTLVELDLSNNLLTQFPNLTHLTKLKKLTLRDNKIQISSNFFDEKRYDVGPSAELNIEHLDLAYNEIVGALTESTFAQFKNLKSLNLRNNHITGILPAALALPNLTELYLDNNNITKLLSGVFDLCPSLSILSLTTNQISELSPDVFSSLELSEIRLAYNNITKLPNDVFSSSTSLYFLDLSNNGLTELPHQVFANSRNLTIVNLDCNKLHTLSADLFAEAKNITHLDLSYNRISQLPANVFFSLQKLKKLDMYFNNLTELPSGLLWNSEDTEGLYFARNQIQKVEENAFPPLEYVQTINLSHNNLTTLRRSSFGTLTKPMDFNRFDGRYYFRINLAGNPLACHDNLDRIVKSYGRIYRDDYVETDDFYMTPGGRRELSFKLAGDSVCIPSEKFADQSTAKIYSS